MPTLLPPNVSHLACVRCGWTSTDFWQWSCEPCGGEARMDVVYRPDAINRLAVQLSLSRYAGRVNDHWRYLPVLPIPAGAPLPPLKVGGTPVALAPRLATWLGVARVVVKDDGRNPSGSSKDRASSVGVVLALVTGSRRIVCASTGNAASSTACIAASVGLPATIFVPKRAPLAKVAQLRIFGAQVFRVDADYDTTWDLCAEVAARQPWFNRNCAHNPYLVEGKKTAGLEVAEQCPPLLDGEAPDWVAMSVGDGCSVAGLARGLVEAHAAGLIKRVPRVLAVQAAGAAPLVAAAQTGVPAHIDKADTVADSLCVGHPRNPDKALQNVARTEGAWIAVSDEEILEALIEVPRRSGMFGEPAAVTAAAGVRRAVVQGIIDPGATVAIVLTGNGLKDPETALKAVTGPIDVQPTVESVLARLSE